MSVSSNEMIFYQFFAFYRDPWNRDLTFPRKSILSLVFRENIIRKTILKKNEKRIKRDVRGNLHWNLSFSADERARNARASYTQFS